MKIILHEIFPKCIRILKKFESELPVLQGSSQLETKHFAFQVQEFENDSTYYDTLQDTFAMEYKWAVSENKYFFGCPLKIYEKHFKTLKKEFLDNLIDANESDFIIKEINELNGYVKNFSFYEYLNLQHRNKIFYSVRKTIIHLKQKLSTDIINSELSHVNIDKSQGELNLLFKERNGIEVNKKTTIQKVENIPFHIDISEIDLSEIIKSLIQAKVIHSYKSEKQVFEHLSKLLDLSFDKREKLQTIKSRTKDKTPFLNRLTIAMENWINND